MYTSTSHYHQFSGIPSYIRDTSHPIRLLVVRQSFGGVLEALAGLTGYSATGNAEHAAEKVTIEVYRTNCSPQVPGRRHSRVRIEKALAVIAFSTGMA